jgi:hypothetical protein
MSAVGPRRMTSDMESISSRTPLTMRLCQMTSAVLVSFGARTNVVISWQIISIILWSTVFGAVAARGVNPVGEN